MDQSKIESLSQLKNKIDEYRKELEKSGFKLNDEQWMDFVESACKYDRLLNKLFLKPRMKNTMPVRNYRRQK